MRRSELFRLVREARLHVLRATRWIRARAGPDVLALIAVLVVCGLAQYRFLSGLDLAQINSVFDSPGTGVFLSSDSPGYIGVATSILHGGSPFDPYRPPVYPAFLALIWLLTGGVNLGAVVFAQKALMLSLPVLVYFLAMAVYPRRLGQAEQ